MVLFLFDGAIKWCQHKNDEHNTHSKIEPKIQPFGGMLPLYSPLLKQETGREEMSPHRSVAPSLPDRGFCLSEHRYCWAP